MAENKELTPEEQKKKEELNKKRAEALKKAREVKAAKKAAAEKEGAVAGEKKATTKKATTKKTTTKKTTAKKSTAKKSTAKKTEQKPVKAKTMAQAVAEDNMKKAWESASKQGKAIADGVTKVANKTSKSIRDAFKAKQTGKGMNVSVEVQYKGKALNYDEMAARAVEDWKANIINHVEKVEVYVKPEEDRVYYVINGRDEGSFQI